MSINSSKVGTFNLTTGSFVINANDGVRVCAMKLLTGGVASFIGAMTVNGVPSAAIPLVVNDPVTIGGDQPIDNLIITVGAGTLELITRS